MWRNKLAYHLAGKGAAQRHRLSGPQGAWGATEQRDAADEGRLEPCGSILVGTVNVNHGKVVRPSQLIASVGRAIESARGGHQHGHNRVAQPVPAGSA